MYDTATQSRYTRLQKAFDSRIQDEIRTAKNIHKSRPDATWAECLVAAKRLFDKAEKSNPPTVTGETP